MPSSRYCCRVLLPLLSVLACQPDASPTPRAATSSPRPASSQPLPAANRWFESRGGIQLRRHEVPEFTAMVARFSLERLELISLTGPSTLDRPRGWLRDFVAHTPFLVAVNGGFFDADERVMGLRATQNRVLSRPHAADWGIFYTTASQPRLEHSKSLDHERLGKANFAIQCGPRIIVEGRALKLKPGKQRRTLIGHDRRHRVVLLASTSKVDLNTLARKLLQTEAQGGLGLVQALALDGGPSTGFLTATAQGHAHEAHSTWQVETGTPVADVVLVVEKGSAVSWSGPHGLPLLSQLAELR